MGTNSTVPTAETINKFLVGYIGDESKKRLHHEKPSETPRYQKKPRRILDPSSPSSVTTSHPNPTANVETFCKTLNYGSEEDSDSEDDENIYSVFLPRVQRLLLESEEEIVNESPTPAPPVIPEPFSLEPDSDTTDIIVMEFLRENQIPLEMDETPESLNDIIPDELSDLPTILSTMYKSPNFQFEWKEFPNPPLAPTVRKEIFSSVSGPTTEFPNPYDAFTAIWTRDIMDYIVVETNRYAQQLAEKKYNEGTLLPTSRITQWRDTNVDELYVYFALLLASGMCVKSTVTDYWTKDDCMVTPQFREYINFPRFFLLNKCLHFVNNNNDLLSSLTRSEAKLYKIAPVVNHLNQKFQALYQLGRNIVIDESLNQWKGVIDIEQYLRKNIVSCNIRTLEISEPQTGYLWKFKLHAEHNNRVENEDSHVLELVEGLQNKGHTLWLDYQHNSPALARILKTLGFDCIGTLKTNSQGVPSQVAGLKKSDMAVGQISGCTSGDVDVVVWRDVSRVALLSTYHGPAVHTSNGKTEPTAIHDYKACMNGVDKRDQMLNMYPIERNRTKVWYKRLFHRLFNVSVLNSFILHKQSSVPDSSRCIKHHDFRKKLIQQLLAKHHNNNNNQVIPIPRVVVNPINMPAITPEVLNHFPQEFGLVPGTTRNERIRRSCIVCRKRMSTYCPACNVPLCAVKCTKSYHEGK